MRHEEPPPELVGGRDVDCPGMSTHVVRLPPWLFPLAVVLLTNSREGGALIAELGRKLGRVALAGLDGGTLQPDPEPAKATDATTKEAVARLAGHYQTQLGHLHLVQRGKRLRANAMGQTIELRATDRPDRPA